MSREDTLRIMEQFNQAFVSHDPTVLPDLVDEQCVMEAIQPAPEGARTVGRAACLAFWQALATDRTTQFTLEEIVAMDDRAPIRWSFRYGPGDDEYVRGVNLMRVRNGLIVEALGYSKTIPVAPLPE